MEAQRDLVGNDVKATRPGLSAARRATVVICDAAGNHRGQGLLLRLSNLTFVLTCHHVIAPVPVGELHVRFMDEDEQLSAPTPADYDELHSHPEQDAVVLRVAGIVPAANPLLHALDPSTYTGGLHAIGLTHLTPSSFDGDVGASTSFQSNVETPGGWPNPPDRYVIANALRLRLVDDARRGISGGVVLCEDGVLGLAHFGLSESATHSREVLVVPLTVWAKDWPELAAQIEPLVDKRLRATATVTRLRDLNIGTHLVIEQFHPDVYLRRESDAAARRSLDAVGAVLIIGRPESGKTRLAYELLRTVGDPVVVLPSSDGPPDALVLSGLSGRDVVIVFDDLHLTAERARPLDWWQRLQDAEPRRCLLMCTTRDGADWKRLQYGQERLLNRLGATARVFTSTVVEFGSEGDADLTTTEGWQLAQALDIDAEKFDQRFDGTPGSLLLELEAMRHRYERLRAELVVGVSMARLLDAAKILHEARQPRLEVRLLRMVAEQVLDSQRLSDDVWEALRRRTAETGFGRFDEAETFQTYRPYLEQCVSFRPVLRHLTTLLDVLSSADETTALFYLGVNFERSGNEDLAITAYRRSLHDGGPASFINLGNLLARRPEFEAVAELTYRAAIEADVPLASVNLGNLLAGQPGRESEAEQLYRNAITAGAVDAYNNLGTLLVRQSGRDADAEAAFHAAVAVGHPKAAANLGALLALQPGRETEAEEVLRSAIAKGQGYGFNTLGILLMRQPGKEAEAEIAFRSARGEEAPTASYNLGNLLADQPGRESEAEEAYRVAIRSGIAEALASLGKLLSQQPGREAEAEQVYRDAIAAGILRAMNDLANLLARQPGREVEAEDVYRAAIAEGDSYALYGLGSMLVRKTGHEEEAEQAFRMAVTEDVPYASFALGQLLASQPGREAEAERLLRDAMAASVPNSATVLGIMLSNLVGRQAEAEAVFRRGIESGDQDAGFFLGDLLHDQPGCEADAERLLRDAIAAGSLDAYAPLWHLLARQPDRFEDAEIVLMEGIDAGAIDASTRNGA